MLKSILILGAAAVAALSWQPAAAGECQLIKNLHHELGWNGGHKTKFCLRRGFDGMTNHPNSSYKAHGGGWCYKGDVQACTAQLPGSACKEHQPGSGQCIRW